MDKQTEYNRDPKYGEFFGFKTDGLVFSFDSALNPVVRPITRFEDPAVVKGRVRRKDQPLPLFSDHSEKTVVVPPGLFVISGPTKAGKSSFVRALQRSLGPRRVTRLLAVEPFDSPQEISDLQAHSSADSALVAAIRLALLDPHALPIIDSLRAPLFETSGPAGRKGVIMPFFTQITRVSNCLAQAGLTVGVTINPMNTESEFVEEFLDKISAAVPASILLQSVDYRGAEVASVRGTISVRPQRTPMAFEFRPDAPVADHQLEGRDFSFTPVEPMEIAAKAPAVLVSAIQTL